MLIRPIGSNVVRLRRLVGQEWTTGVYRRHLSSSRTSSPSAWRTFWPEKNVVQENQGGNQLNLAILATETNKCDLITKMHPENGL